MWCEKVNILWVFVRWFYDRVVFFMIMFSHLQRSRWYFSKFGAHTFLTFWPFSSSGTFSWSRCNFFDQHFFFKWSNDFSRPILFCYFINQPPLKNQNHFLTVKIKALFTKIKLHPQHPLTPTPHSFITPVTLFNKL